MALLFSTFTSPILAAVFSLGVYIVGHLTWGLQELMLQVPPGFARWLIQATYFVLPDLETFNIRARVVHGESVGGMYVADAFAYATAYSLGMIVLAVIVFRRRDLT